MSDDAWLTADLLGAPIELNGADVRVMREPRELLAELRRRARTAERCVVLASLYLGTGDEEQSLVEELAAALERSPLLTVSILLDYTRGTRGHPSSVSMLDGLVSKYPNRMRACFYHTPKLRGWLRWALPERLNELIGLQHMKLYAFDDAVIVSGANLSANYFDARQDRYLLFGRCPAFAGYCGRLVDAVSRLSFRLQAGGELVWPRAAELHPFLGNERRFTEELRASVSAAAHSTHDEGFDMGSGSRRENVDIGSGSHHDSRIYPVLQMGPHGLDDERRLLSRLFASGDDKARLTLASGYFNLTDEYCDQLIDRGRYRLDILTAAPEANGFFTARGLMRFIPHMYTHLLRAFVCRTAEQQRVTVREYSREGWTFHAKGLWLAAATGGVRATYAGSSNFGARSVERDLEFGVLLTTESEGLRARLEDERAALFEHSHLATSDTFKAQARHVPFWLRCLARYIRRFF